jgi:hypothetical protein
MINRYGWWFVLRSFDLTKKSQYWDEVSDEAIGGPAYKYNDIILKGRRVENIGGDPETTESRQQNTDIFKEVFYILGDIRPKKEDIIMAVPLDVRQQPTPPKTIVPVELFDIEHVEAKIEKGVIVSKCSCRKKTPINDKTLIGPIPVKHKKIY